MLRFARDPSLSVLVPIVLGIVIPFWGLLLAIAFVFRKPKRGVT